MGVLKNIALASLAITLCACSGTRMAYDIEIYLNTPEVRTADLKELVENVILVLDKQGVGEKDFIFPLHLTVFNCSPNKDTLLHKRLAKYSWFSQGVSAVSQQIAEEIKLSLGELKTNDIPNLSVEMLESAEEQPLQKVFEVLTEESEFNLSYVFKLNTGKKNKHPKGNNLFLFNGDSIMVLNNADSLTHCLKSTLPIYLDQPYLNDESLRGKVAIVVNPIDSTKGIPPRNIGGVSGPEIEVVGTTENPSSGHAINMVVIGPLANEYYLASGYYSEPNRAKYNATIGLDQLIGQNFVNAKILQIRNTYRTVLYSSRSLDMVRKKKVLYSGKFPNGLVIIEIENNVAIEKN